MCVIFRELSLAMPRTYVRKTINGQIPHDVMLQAVMLVRDGIPVRKAADAKGISKSALSRYVLKYRVDPTAVLTPNYTHSQIFTQEQEQSLEEYLITCSQMFHGLTPKKVRCLAYEMAVEN